MKQQATRACLNEDDSNFFFQPRPAGCDETALRALIDHYDLGGVDQIMFNINAQCVNYPDSAWEMIGSQPDRDPGEAPDLAWNFRTAVREYAAAGLNPYAFWLAESRKRGISPWISIRMNDIHNVDNEKHYLHSDFWRNHPEWRRIRHREPVSWMEKALDFGHSEVRDHALALIAETLEKFDLDGIELDWMRFPYHFRPGFEDEGRSLTLELHRRVRALADAAAKRLGHAVGIAVRVAATPQNAWELGFDVPAMSREKLVDIVIPTAFWATTDTAMPIALWRALLTPETRLYAGIELLTRAYPAAQPMYSTPSMVRSQCAAYFHQGADKLYLFNYMDFMLREHAEAFRAIIGSAGDPEKAAAGSRRAVVTYCDTFAPGVPTPLPLPVPLTGLTVLRPAVGPAPEPGRAVRVVLGGGEPIPEECAVYLNDRRLTRAALPDDCAVPEGSGELTAFDATGAVKSGDNILELRSDTASGGELRWAEIHIAAR